MPEATLERGQELGLVTGEGQLTPYGKLVENTLDHPHAKAIRENFKRGFIDENLNLTRAGTIFTGTREDAVEGGPDDWLVWRQTGAEDNWKKQSGDDPFLSQVGAAVGELATKTAPKAVGAAVFGMEMPLFVGQRRLEQKTGADVYEVLSGKDKETRDAMRTMIRGGLSKETFRGWEMIDVGLDYILTKKKKDATEEEISRAQWNYENMMLMYDRMTAAQATEIADVSMAKLLGGNQQQAAQDARSRVAEAESRLTPEQAAGAVSMGGAAGNIGLGDPANLLTMGWPMMARGAAGTLVRGGFSAQRAAELAKDLAVKEARLRALGNLGAMGRTPATNTAIRRLDDEITGIQSTLARMEQRSGTVGYLKDLTRAGLSKAAQSKPGRGVAWVGGKLDDAAEAVSSHARTFLNTAAGAGVAGLAMGVPGGGAVAIAAGLAANSKRVKTLLRSAHVLGAEFLRRRGTLPYFQRLANRAKDTPAVRNPLLAADLISRPIKGTGRVAAAAGRAMAAEAPFSYLAAGGEDGWLVDAVAEGLVFGLPGEVRGLVHSMGGMPATAKAAEFDAMALQDAAELRRVLPDDAQRAGFDALPTEARRMLGAYSAVFPDLSVRISDQGPSFYNRHTQTVHINPASSNALAPMIAHEVGHFLESQGHTDLVVETLVGEGGLLLDADGSLNAEGRRFKAAYESRPGAPELDNRNLAIEYFAEQAVPGLLGGVTGRRQLQRLARQSSAARFVGDIFDRYGFTRQFLLRSGVFLDRNGNPVRGHGATGAVEQSPLLAGVMNDYVRRQAGRSARSADRARQIRAEESGASTQRGIDPRMDPHAPEIEQDRVLFQRDKDGRLKRDRKTGVPLAVDADVWKGFRHAPAEALDTVAARHGVEPVADRAGKKSYLFDEGQWADFIAEIEKSGWYNQEQIDNLRRIARAMNGDGDRALAVNYHKKIDTNNAGKKALAKGVVTSTRIGTPFRLFKAKNGNIGVDFVDFGAIQENALKVADTDLGRKLYNGDVSKIVDDVWQMAKNHAAGIPNAQFFKSPEKRNFLNAVFGPVNKLQRDANPLLGEGGPKGFKRIFRPAVRTLNLHAINKVKDASAPAIPFTHEGFEKNLLPEPAALQSGRGDQPQSAPAGQDRSGAARPVSPGEVVSILSPERRPPTYGQVFQSAQEIARQTRELKAVARPVDRREIESSALDRDQGEEHHVFFEPGFVTKIVRPDSWASGASPAQYFARWQDLGTLYPALEPEFLGMAGDSIVVRQPFVEGEVYTDAASLERDMAAEGWAKIGPARYRHESGAVIRDARPSNVIKGTDGRLWPFDVVVEQLPPTP